MQNHNVIPFTKEDIKGYLDRSIDYWRARRNNGDVIAEFYVDAFQSVRMTIFDELKPE